MKFRSFKHKVRRKLNGANCFIALMAIMVSFLIVKSSDAVTVKRAGLPAHDNLIESASRIADAFEIYNQKRFSP